MLASATAVLIEHEAKVKVEVKHAFRKAEEEQSTPDELAPLRCVQSIRGCAFDTAILFHLHVVSQSLVAGSWPQ